MSAFGLYQAKTVRPFAAGACWVVIPQLFGDVQVEVRRFAAPDMPVLNQMGWVAFEGGAEENPVWLSVATSPVPIPVEPPGGGDGPAEDFLYVHSQPSASLVWVISHMLGGYPNVTVVETATGDNVVGEVNYLSTDQLTITFSVAISGTAYLS